MYRETIFIQPPNDCFYNRAINNVKVSADICMLQDVAFDISGATKIMSGLTSGTTGVYVLPYSAETIEFNFNFSGDVSAFTAQNATFKYDIYKAGKEGSFGLKPIISSDIIEYDSPTGITGNVLTQQINLNDLTLDGDYLIKGFFDFDICTTFLNKLGVRLDTSQYKKGVDFGIYNPISDFYFVALREAEIPKFNQSFVDSGGVGKIITRSYTPNFSGQTGFTVNSVINGEMIVNLNGLTLVNGIEYFYNQQTTLLTMTNPTKLSDVITVSFVGDLNNGLQGITNNDIILVDNPIVSGNTDGQGNNEIYYNLSTSKYEIYTSVNSVRGMIISLNGVSLAANIDYYQSTSNPRRWILNGLILPGDVINLFYVSETSLINEVFGSDLQIAWSIENEPKPNTNVNGMFNLQITDSNDMLFNNVKFSSLTPYEVGINAYNTNIIITGNNGDELIYRVCNNKKYTTITGDEIKTIAYSEVIPIKISSNSINSY